MKNLLIRAVSFLLLLSLLTGLALPMALAAPEEGTAEGTEEVEVQASPEVYQVPPITIEAKAALLVDLDSEQILYEQEAHAKNYPASITKIMTALLTLEAVGREEVSLNQEVTISDDTFYDMDEESSTAGLLPGEVITVENLLYCLMVASANEAANALAVAVAGSVDAFVERMNQRAAELGMEDTHFVNPHGLHDADHYSSAYDIYLMAKEAMTHAVFRDIVSTKQYTVPATNLSGERVLSNTNGLLTGYHYPGYSIKGTIGIKTGSTGPAGYCLCAAVKRSGHTLVSVVLGADNPKIPHNKDDVTRMQFVESARLQEWGFENFTYVTLLDADATKEEVAVRASFQDNHVILKPDHSVLVLIPGAYDESLLETKLTLKEDPISEEITAGEALGTMTVSYGGEVYDTVDMVAVSDVSYSPFLAFVNRVNDVLGNLYVRILLLAALVLVVVGVGRRLWHAKQEAIAAARMKHQENMQARRARRAQVRQEREEVNAQRQADYEVKKREERRVKAQRAQEKEEQRQAERRRREEELRVRREEEERRRQERERQRREEQERRREEERRRREEERIRREDERRQREAQERRRREEERRQREDAARRRQQERQRREREEFQRNPWEEDYPRSRNRRSSRPEDYEPRDRRRSTRDFDWDAPRRSNARDYDRDRGRSDDRRRSRPEDYESRDRRREEAPRSERRYGEDPYRQERRSRPPENERRGRSSQNRRGDPPPRRR